MLGAGWRVGGGKSLGCTGLFDPDAFGGRSAFMLPERDALGGRFGLLSAGREMLLLELFPALGGRFESGRAVLLLFGRAFGLLLALLLAFPCELFPLALFPEAEFPPRLGGGV